MHDKLKKVKEALEACQQDQVVATPNIPDPLINITGPAKILIVTD